MAAGKKWHIEWELDGESGEKCQTRGCKLCSNWRCFIRPFLMYGSKNWELRKVGQNLLERTEIRVFRWSMGINRVENTVAEEIKAWAYVANISEKIREARLRWLGHLERNTIRTNENTEDY